MIASLPMYDWPKVQPANDRLWAAIRDRLAAAGIAAPERLSRDGDPWGDWTDPSLVLSQTCGLPYRSRLHGRVALVGTPDYGLPGMHAGYYCSVFVVPAGAAGDWTGFAGKRLAVNGFDSQSGWSAPQNGAQSIGKPFVEVLTTGAHVNSARAVAEGRADIAAIDAVTWRLLARSLPDLAGRLRVAGHTDPTPGLPLITAAGRDPGAIFDAVAGAIAAMSDADRAATGLRGLVRIPPEAYLAIPTAAPIDRISRHG